MVFEKITPKFNFSNTLCKIKHYLILFLCLQEKNILSYFFYV